jgi:hypothetical protein
MARCASVAAVNNAYCPEPDLKKVDLDAVLTPSVMADCFKRVLRIYQNNGEDDDGAKSKKMSDALTRSLVGAYSPPHKTGGLFDLADIG